MIIRNLTEDSNMYTSNVFLVTGSWNKISDLNTLIDVGRDISIIEKINQISTGVGKHKVDQVILTHSHYDHVGILDEIVKAFKPKIYAFSDFLNKVHNTLKHGQEIKIGDKYFEVIHVTAHSSDSICLYCKTEGILFSGDTPLIIKSKDLSYDNEYISILERLCTLPINKIYFGHNKELNKKCNEQLYNTLKNITINN